jgi:hypothetical protein
MALAVAGGDRQSQKDRAAIGTCCWPAISGCERRQGGSSEDLHATVWRDQGNVKGGCRTPSRDGKSRGCSPMVKLDRPIIK